MYILTNFYVSFFLKQSYKNIFHQIIKREFFWGESSNITSENNDKLY